MQDKSHQPPGRAGENVYICLDTCRNSCKKIQSSAAPFVCCCFRRKTCSSCTPAPPWAPSASFPSICIEVICGPSPRHVLLLHLIMRPAVLCIITLQSTNSNRKQCHSQTSWTRQATQIHGVKSNLPLAEFHNITDISLCQIV